MEDLGRQGAITGAGGACLQGLTWSRALYERLPSQIQWFFRTHTLLGSLDPKFGRIDSLISTMGDFFFSFAVTLNPRPHFSKPWFLFYISSLFRTGFSLLITKVEAGPLLVGLIIVARHPAAITIRNL